MDPQQVDVKNATPSCSAPNCTDKEPHSDIPLNITLCSNQIQTQGGGKQKASFGKTQTVDLTDEAEAPVSRTELKKIELCTRDPCPFGEENCAFLHPTKGKIDLDLHVNKKILFRTSLESPPQQGGTGKQETRSSGGQMRKYSGQRGRGRGYRQAQGSNEVQDRIMGSVFRAVMENSKGRI